MAANLSPSSSSPPGNGDLHHIPTALALPAANAVTATRRLPPPCWTPEETVALIDAYRDKWYSLRRSNLRANHWQEVADDVALRCPIASPRKTAVQCRHKMEKLRKRYRAEIQRAAARGGVHRFSTTWAHFQNMHAMEKGPNRNPSPPSFSSSDDEEDDDERKNSIKRINDLYNHHSNNNHKQKGFQNSYQQPIDYGSSPGFRVKIPGATPNAYNMFDEMPSHQSNPRFHNSGYGTSSNRDGFSGRSEIGKRAEIENPKIKKVGTGSEVAAAIQALGEGFMKMEKMKMDMARQIEEIRMDMELKRTEMILESQQRIIEAFAKAISQSDLNNNKPKRMQHSMPDC
ncbi:hypothetical protein CASFOL_019594 [Castilleja foliolosa]|uniref:Myb-like domain-containing protein n=1 Tax=Castilleja foliolosa TaxID=1961234 RepID=A0ABD3D4U0_9LAMI